MVIDSSAVVAILEDEEEKERFMAAIADDPRRLFSAASYVETSSVIYGRRQHAGLKALDALLHRFDMEIIDVTTEQAMIAREAYVRYGRGNHRAGLNLGDCFSYALAKVENEPLLFKGNDFSRTDLVSALG